MRVYATCVLVILKQTQYFKSMLYLFDGKWPTRFEL